MTACHRILTLLADGKPKAVADVIIKAGCSRHDIGLLASSGHARFPPAQPQGSLICITPRGLAAYFESDDPAVVSRRRISLSHP